jgi:hypothetical protein
LDEWYVHNASLWLDLRIVMMTIKLLLRGRVSSQEILADTEQVQSKTNGLGVASGEEWFAQGHVTGGGKPYTATAVQKMLRGG